MIIVSVSLTHEVAIYQDFEIKALKGQAIGLLLKRLGLK